MPADDANRFGEGDSAPVTGGPHCPSYLCVVFFFTEGDSHLIPGAGQTRMGLLIDLDGTTVPLQRLSHP
jgi:hypothetical protein